VSKHGNQGESGHISASPVGFILVYLPYGLPNQFVAARSAQFGYDGSSIAMDVRARRGWAQRRSVASTAREVATKFFWFAQTQ